MGDRKRGAEPGGSLVDEYIVLIQDASKQYV
jgi:hypothetical protein